MSRVAVVGGGVSGIAAALACADSGADVTLYESRRWLGGATFSIERNGHSLDNGQHVALRCCVEYVSFLERLGVAELVPFQDRLRIPVLAGDGAVDELRRSRLPAPLHLAGPLLRYAPLTFRERVTALFAAAALRRLDPEDEALDAETFGSWLRRHRQSERAIARLWDLVVLPTINLPSDEASLALAVKVFRTGLLDTNDGADIGVPSVPLLKLHDEPARTALEDAGVDVRLGATVTAVEAGPAVDDGDERTPYDAVVVAVPHSAVPGLLPAGAVDAATLAGLGASPIVNVHVLFDRRVLDETFAVAFESPLQWVFDTTSQSGAEGQMLTVSLSAAKREQRASVEELRKSLLPELERLLPRAAAAQVLDVAVTREPRATFAGRPGTRRLRPGPETAVPGVFLAGSYTATGWPATMESAVRSGRAAAEQALSAPARAREVAR